MSLISHPESLLPIPQVWKTCHNDHTHLVNVVIFYNTSFLKSYSFTLLLFPNTEHITGEKNWSKCANSHEVAQHCLLSTLLKCPEMDDRETLPSPSLSVGLRSQLCTTCPWSHMCLCWPKEREEAGLGREGEWVFWGHGMQTCWGISLVGISFLPSKHSERSIRVYIDCIQAVYTDLCRWHPSGLNRSVQMVHVFPQHYVPHFRLQQDLDKGWQSEWTGVSFCFLIHQGSF